MSSNLFALSEFSANSFSLFSTISVPKSFIVSIPVPSPKPSIALPRFFCIRSKPRPIACPNIDCSSSPSTSVDGLSFCNI